MAIIIASQEQIDDYFERPEVNQSSLKDLKDGLGSFLAAIAKKQKDKEENKPTPDYFLIGGAVDCLLTGEEGEFEQQYYVSRLEKKPSDVEMAIVESVFHELEGAEVLDQVNWEDCYDAILAAANSVRNGDKIGWQNNWKDDTRVSKLILAGADYFEDLKNSSGMKILSSEMADKIHSIVKSLSTNPRTKKYFDRELQAQQEFMDFYYQLPIYFTYNGIDCKALMDLVVVHKDENGNIIKIEPIDLKTMSGNTLQFIGKIKQHRYDIQAAWYTKALSEYFDCQPDAIAPFKFVVESTTSIGTPLVFEISKETLLHGEKGAEAGMFNSADSGRQLYYPRVKGYEQLMKEYAYYAEQGFKQDVTLVENPEVINIDWTKGIV